MRCPRCKQDKDASGFRPSWTPGTWCRVCDRERARLARGMVGTTDQLRANPTGEQCAICGVAATALDHNPSTGRIRGWLCREDNISLGILADDPQRLRMAALYLERGEAA